MKNETFYFHTIWTVGLPREETDRLRKNLFADNFKGEIFELKTEEAVRKIEDCQQKNKEIFVVATEQEVLKKAAQKNFATIGYQKAGAAEYLYADMIVEGFEETDLTFFNRVYERHFGIPWTILETKRCVVRELALTDLDGLFAMYEEKGMTDYMEGLYPYEQEEAYQKAYIENMYHFYGYGMWLVFEKQTGRLIGRAGLECREELDNEMELGYAIRTSCQRNGYAYEVCCAILKYAREVLFAEKIHCLIQKGNTASERLAEKLGFSKVAERDIQGRQMSDYIAVFLQTEC